MIAFPAEDEVRARIEGQTADLGLEIEWVEQGAHLSEAGPPPLERARALLAARPRPADSPLPLAIVLVDRGPARYTVSVVDLRARRVLQRELERRSSEPSATLESVALIVRGALDALAVGGEIGVAAPRQDVPEASAELGAEASPPDALETDLAETDVAPTAAATTTDAQRERSAVLLGAALGLQTLLDRGAPALVLGAELQVRRGGWHVSFAAGQSLARELGHPSGVTIQIRSTPVRARLGYRLVESSRVRLEGFLGLELSLLTRRTLQVSEGWVAAPDARTLGLSTGLGGLLSLELGRHTVGFVEASADLALRPRRFVVAQAGVVTEVAAQRRAHATLRVGVLVHLERDRR